MYVNHRQKYAIETFRLGWVWAYFKYFRYPLSPAHEVERRCDFRVINRNMSFLQMFALQRGAHRSIWGHSSPLSICEYCMCEHVGERHVQYLHDLDAIYCLSFYVLIFKIGYESKQLRRFRVSLIVGACRHRRGWCDRGRLKPCG